MLYEYLGMEYHTKREEPWHAKTMPANIAHKKLLMRVIIAGRKKGKYEMYIF